MTTKKISITLVSVAILIAAWYAISPLFNNIELDEALPENIVAEVEEGTSEQIEEPVQSQQPEGSIETPIESIIERFPVMGTTGHPASGFVRVLETTSGTVIRYEDFETINGPNLHVYLAKDLNANDYIDLGEIRGTQGNINYPLPKDVNVTDYKYVMYWCVPFSVLFNYAEIN